MVELRPIFKKAYWTLAAAGLVYVSWVYAMTYPSVQRLYVVFGVSKLLNTLLISKSALYAHKVNPAIWQDLNDVENFGFLSKKV
jgi:hypothetical protein